MLSVKETATASGSSYYLTGELSQEKLIAYLGNSNFQALFERYQQMAKKDVSNRVQKRLWTQAVRYCKARSGYPKIEQKEDLDFSDRRQVELAVYQSHENDFNWSQQGKWQSNSLRGSTYLLKKGLNQSRSIAVAKNDDENARFNFKWKVTEGLSQTVQVCCQVVHRDNF